MGSRGTGGPLGGGYARAVGRGVVVSAIDGRIRRAWVAAGAPRRGTAVYGAPMDRHELLAAIRAAHAPIEAALMSLDDDALRGGAAGMPGWTRKDVLAHVEAWTRHATAVVDGVRTGVDPYPDDGEAWDLDAFNARVLEENRHRAPADVRAGEASSFEALLAAVEQVPESALFADSPVPWLEGTLADAVAADSTGHWPEHVPHLA